MKKNSELRIEMSEDKEEADEYKPDENSELRIIEKAEKEKKKEDK